MRHAVECRARQHRLRRYAGEGFSEPFLDQREKLVVSDAVEHVFQPRLVAVGAVAEIDEDADDGVRHLGCIRRLDDDVAVFGEIPVPGDAAEPEAKPDAGLGAKAVLHFDRGERDVVGVFQHRDLAGAVEGDVELARQPVQRTIVEDMVVPLPGIFAGVQQLLRIDPGRRRARDVADVVSASAARAQAEVLNTLDQRHRVLRRNLAHLQIGARGDVAERSAQFFDEVGQSGELPVLHDPVRDP